VVATGGHFASAAAAARLGAVNGSGDGGRSQVFPVATPLPELIAQLNDFQPAVLAPYATTAALLATEQQAGRLRIRPALVALAAEGLPAGEPARIAAAFGAVVGNSYGTPLRPRTRLHPMPLPPRPPRPARPAPGNDRQRRSPACRGARERLARRGRRPRGKPYPSASTVRRSRSTACSLDRGIQLREPVELRVGGRGT